MEKQAKHIDEISSDALEAVKKQIDHLTNKAQNYAGKAKDQASQTVKDYPFTSIAVAAGIGFIVGLLLKR
jgi:ElaB/YqjD/DUF883 family membrane-anchored ribosome-binding protein